MIDVDTIKPGDTLFYAGLAWGRDPKITKLKVKSVGPRLIITNSSRWDRKKNHAFYATEAEARVALRAIIEKQIEAAKNTVTEWEDKLVEIDEEIAKDAAS